MSSVGDNQEIRIPADRSEASKWVFQRLVKLTNDKRAYSDHLRDLIKEVKVDKKIPPEQIRLAMKLNGMTPEQRETWATRVSAAAALFGYSALGVADETDRTSPMWQVIEASKFLVAERADLTDEIKRLKAAARERGDIDVDTISSLVKFAGKDPDERADWFASFDTMATFLGLW